MRITTNNNDDSLAIAAVAMILGLMFLIRALVHADIDSQIATAQIPICKALTHVGDFAPMILAVVI